ncbi:proline racemase family protein [Aliiroseovarius lamellibrachiae]|uniref:4-hydroxyproline epimerase n=1 Tax=Aliiroseovarius lamellibrachiae TaxID=1924933 RepID=UPI001BE06C50|nr:proline racemase family protein [Aliiroseovarius lamellibrachiae]MBT2131926.1 proline racemase family protein [Aliiroseovarius lamellibrachiae]
MRVIDSHTAGEPTRVVIEGGPDLGTGPLAIRAARLWTDHPDFGPSTLCEPRGHDAIVGALLTPPSDPSCATGVIFFNTVANLGMCGHATIGLAAVLYHMGRITLGVHRFETPVGVVEVDLLSPDRVRAKNVESFRHLKDVTVEVPELGRVSGDVAYGGNWFFLSKHDAIPLDFARLSELTSATIAIRNALERNGITGAGGAYIDHIELFGPAHGQADSRNFVLCPGGAYDRSPCGTGSSAKLACLVADGMLAPNETWVQESIIGSTYDLTYVPGNTGIIATIEGAAYVTSETTLLFSNDDPYRTGIRA